MEAVFIIEYPFFKEVLEWKFNSITFQLLFQSQNMFFFCEMSWKYDLEVKSIIKCLFSNPIIFYSTFLNLLPSFFLGI